MRWRRFGGGLGVSLLIHAAVAGALLFSFTWPEPDVPEQPPEEPVVDVTLVPPPEPPAPEEPAKEEPAPEEKPPEPAEAEAPPPPPPPAATEPPPSETPPETAAPEVTAPPILPMRPVVQFGDKDAGPRKADDGSDAIDPAETAAEDPEEPPVAEAEKPLEPPKEEAAAKPLPEIALPEADLEGQVPDPSAEGEALSGEAIAALNEAEVKEPETPTDEANVGAAAPKLDEAKKLFSTVISSDPAAMTAMNGLPRERRADQLCTTELREQLRNASPPFRPELLPSFGLKKGNLLAPAKTAFRASGQWYDLSFRCEVDDGATKVVSFGFSVGAAIPRSEWRKRRFPDF
ncbi:DUF930 domain-containing protein [Rhizobium sp. SL42]|uniref:DUF930 domain-containing protein n=1 Tax=Rhizobium sp. SL42 TaxID=2806346 RepID=UPI002351A348|nr:DUF930 domain-containing protein [Rhizobium sp. SL42]